jgi:hypothetical protein
MLLEDIVIPDLEKFVRQAVEECGYDIPMPALGKHSKAIMEYAVEVVEKYKNNNSALGAGMATSYQCGLIRLAGSSRIHKPTKIRPSSWWQSRQRDDVEVYRFQYWPLVAKMYKEDEILGKYPRPEIQRIAIGLRHALDYIMSLVKYAENKHGVHDKYEQTIAKAALKALGIPV